jgi:dienelactone hydrolase
LIEEDFRLKHFGSLELRCTLRLPRGKGPFRLVITAPGFLGFKDWGFLPYVGQRLCHAGFAAMSFSHALCGVTENPLEITDLEAFSSNSTTQELKDWDLILDWILAGRLPYWEKLKLNAFGIVGHSRGGSYGILMASRVPQIQSVVTWGAIQTFHRFDAESQRRWRQAGSLEIGTNAFGSTLRLQLGALEALERNSDRLDVLRAMRYLCIPVLLLHGREDKRVPVAEGLQLWRCADQRLSRFHIIESAGHTFRTRHPFTVPSPPLMECVNETLRWFGETLPH